MLSRLASRSVVSKGLSSAKAFSVTPGQRSKVLYEDDNIILLDEINKNLVPSSDPIPISMEEKVYHWKKSNELFFGKERDLKNFPHPEYSVYGHETYQMGIIPTRWFKALYPQLGVSGCYSLIWFGAIFGISKEILIITPDFAELFAAILLLNAVRFKWGDKIKAKLETMVKQDRVELYEKPLEMATSGYRTELAEVDTDISRQDAVPVIFQAKQEQVELQLEVEYRKRMAEVYQTVKRRLEYQADLEHTQRTFEQNHMVNWIVNSVQKAITPQQEKENIASCIRTLKTMSANAAV